MHGVLPGGPHVAFAILHGSKQPSSPTAVLQLTEVVHAAGARVSFPIVCTYHGLHAYITLVTVLLHLMFTSQERTTTYTLQVLDKRSNHDGV